MVSVPKRTMERMPPGAGAQFEKKGLVLENIEKFHKTNSKQ